MILVHPKAVAIAATLILFLALAAPVAADKEMLLQPDKLTEQAPDSYKVTFDTSAGKIVIQVTREWAPIGADRFYNLAKNGFYDDVRFFRVITGFMAQFGMSGDPQVTEVWSDKTINDDPATQSNAPGYITFAKTGAPNSRTTQVFINLASNAFLDKQGFAPFGQVVEGMETVKALHAGYGEGAPGGKGPNQGVIRSAGNAYLEKDFPELDYIKSTTVE